MRYMTDDLRIKEIKELAPPSHLLREYPCDEKTSLTVFEARESIHRILHGEDDRHRGRRSAPARSMIRKRRSTTRAGCRPSASA